MAELILPKQWGIIPFMPSQLARSITIAHSPDPDDAFLFYGMTHGKIGRPGLVFEHLLQDIESLNRWALEGRFEITAMSVHAYAHAADRYVILPYGTSMGVRYGPILVSRTPMTLNQLKGEIIAVPGLLTTAFALLKMVLPECRTEVVPFDQIMSAVKEGRFKAGLLIHEGQLTYAKEGFHPVVDFGVWWQNTMNLPLPLGLNCVRKDLGEPVMKELSQLLLESIAYGRTHRDEAVGYAMQYGRGLARDLTDRFVDMYVNEYAVELGEEGRRSIAVLLKKMHEVGIVSRLVIPEFVES